MTIPQSHLFFRHLFSKKMIFAHKFVYFSRLLYLRGKIIDSS